MNLPPGWKPWSVHWLPTGVVYVQIVNIASENWRIRGAGKTYRDALRDALRQVEQCES